LLSVVDNILYMDDSSLHDITCLEYISLIKSFLSKKSYIFFFWDCNLVFARFFSNHLNRKKS